MAKAPPPWLLEVLSAADPERVLRDMIGRVIDQAHHTPRAARSPGQPLRLLLFGYSGAGNVGAEMRVLEIIRQLRVLGAGRLELTVTALGRHVPPGGYDGVPVVPIPADLAGFLADVGRVYDGVIVTEGSLFTSTFSDTLAALLAGALGVFGAGGKLSVGYGSEAGAMTADMTRFASEQCRESLVICRNEESARAVDALGLRALPGTDTAWTYEPADPEGGRRLLREHGWDGHAAIVAVCPINPFWWPVRPDARRFQAFKEHGEHRDSHYTSIFFHQVSDDSNRRYASYVQGLADAITVFTRERQLFPVIVGMEPLDRTACDDVASRLPVPPPIFCSTGLDTVDGIVGVLRAARMVVSSRFHGLVTAMAAQRLPVGVSMDARIVNLMRKLGRPDLAIAAHEPDLGERVVTLLRTVGREAEQIEDAIGRMVAGEVRMMGRMGLALLDEIARIYPEQPRGSIVHLEDALPSRSPAVQRLMHQYG